MFSLRTTRICLGLILGSYASPQHQSGRKACQAAITTVLPSNYGSDSMEVKKLIDSSFIREEQHPDWVAKIVPVTK